MIPIVFAEDLAIALLLGVVFYSALSLLAHRERAGCWQWVVTLKHFGPATVAVIAIAAVQIETRKIVTAKVDSEMLTLGPTLRSLAIASVPKVIVPNDEEQRARSLLRYAQPLGARDRASALSALALIEGNREKYDTAIEIATRSIILNPSDPQLRNSRGVLYYDRSNYREALADFELASSLLDREEPGSELKAVVAGNAAVTARDLGLPAEARVKFDRSIALLQRPNLEKVIYMTQLGELLLDLGKPTAAREELRHALAAAVSTSDSSREGDVHRDLAKVARFVGEPSDALTEIQLAMQKHNDDVEKSIDLEIWAWIEYDMGSLDSAREHTEKGLSLAKSVSFQKEIGQHQHIRGRIEQLAGNNTGANTYYSDALRIFDSLGYLRGKGEVLYSIAYLHYEAAWARVNSQDDLEAAKPEFEQAKKEFEDVLKLFELSDYREGIARAYGGIGVTLAFLFPEQPELAISDFRRSLEIARDIQYPLVEANQLGNLGIMYKRAVQLSLGNKAEQITEAKKNLESALSIHRRIGYKLGEGKQLTNLAELKFSTGDYCGAASLIKQAISVFDRLNAKPLLERARSFAEAIDQQCSKIKSPTN